ncbi:MAG: triacylglycerol lipase [Actinomycetota bacterium]|nr:triacylglycerol lipase [Actinomycetota bacterium]
MSRRRRMLAAAVVCLLLAAGGAAFVLTRGGDVVPPRERSAAEEKPGPVLLVPGYGGGTAVLEQLAGRLRAAGRQATVVPMPGDATGDLRAQALVLGAAVLAAKAAGAASVDVVGFSAGGVVARLWAANDGGAADARRIVTLGSPHHGTDLATFAGALAPDQCPLACRQLAPGSDLITELNQGDETPDGPLWVSIWTTQDQVVIPADSARLSGARNVVVQDVCAGRSVGHGQLPADQVVGGLVLRALAAGPVAAPGPSDCAALAASG